MKRKQRNFVALVALMSAFFATSVVLALDVPKTKADHLALAEKYEKMAADEEAIVKEHTEMKQDYKANQASLPKQSREKSLAEMDRHCDAIIAEAKKLAEDYKAMAKWHKMRASELEK